MKTRSLLMVMAALAMAGCSQNEVTEINPDTHRAIGLNVYTGVQTRGTETTTTSLKGSGNGSDAGFGILAYKTSSAGWNTEKSSTAPGFMYNEHATWSGTPGSWSYETSPRFWPTNGDKITFFAYAPYEASPADGSNQNIVLSGQSVNDAPKITFEVKTTNNWKDMVDLVTDARGDIKDKTSADNGGTVSFKFTHVLTKIADVKVKPDVSLGNNTKIFVKGLKLDTGTEKLYSKATYDFGTDNWSSTGATYFSGVKDLTAFLNKNPVSQWGYTESSIDASDNNTATSLFPTDQALYFIPVDNVTGTSAVGDLKLEITYDIVTKVGDGGSYLSSTLTDKEVSLPKETFKKGTAHKYVLTIKMNAINISVEDNVTEWDNGGESAMNVK